MKNLGQYLKYTLICVGILFTSLFVWKSCHPDKDNGPVITQQQYDMLKKAYEQSLEDYNIRIGEFMDSLKLNDSTIGLLEMQRDSLRRETIANKNKADKFAILYRDAKKALDTLRMLQSCDSLSEQYGILSQAIVDLDSQYTRFITAKNETIEIKDSIIAIKDVIIDSQTVKYKSADSTIKQISTQYTEEKSRHKKSKETGWFGILVAFILGLLIGN
jgi:hypothetical protein